MDDALPARISELLSKAQDRLAACGKMTLLDIDQQHEYLTIAWETLSANRDEAEVLRKAQLLQAFAQRASVEIADQELIIGSQMFNFVHQVYEKFLSPQQAEQIALWGNHCHIAVDYGRVLQLGVSGLIEQIDQMPTQTDIQHRNRQAFSQAVDAFSHWISRHAQQARNQADACDDPQRRQELMGISERCQWLAQSPPRTFAEALQMVWFTQIFLHAEGMAAAISFGRFDQYVWPFLAADLDADRISLDEAEELLACFWLKCCEGDESQNLILGGVDEQGQLAENPLSLLCLKVARKLKVWQPSVSVRICPETSQEFWDEAIEYTLAATGQPSFFNDPVVIRSLESLDIPTPRARDWAAVGCYEASPQGDTYPLTVAGKMSLPNAFLDYLGEAGSPEDFDTFSAGFKAFLKSHYEGLLAQYQQQWNGLRDRCASPFESVCVTGCLESGLAVEEGGARFNLFGVNILGLGTILDSLWVIRQLVYQEGKLTLDELREHLHNNFSDESLLWMCRGVTGKYGTDNEQSNRLAEEYSTLISDMVIESRLEGGVRPSPAFFWFGGDISVSVDATPDGRRKDDRISYGVAPAVYCGSTGVTSIINSVANVAHDRCPCGNPLTVSLNRSDVQGVQGRQRLKQIVEAYFAQGGFHLHVNILDAKQLQEAKEYPEQHQDLTVRISGFSARFTTLSRDWQDAVIERTAKGM